MSKIISIILTLCCTIIVLCGCGIPLTSSKPAEKNNPIEVILFSDIVGGWESTASGGSYYVFNSDSTYAWYRSSSNLNDDYYTGNMVVLRGEQACKDLGIKLENVKKMTELSGASITIDDIYSLKLKPTFLKSSGVDRSSEIDESYEMKLLFIYIDDNNAQALNFKTGDQYNLVKK